MQLLEGETIEGDSSNSFSILGHMVSLTFVTGGSTPRGTRGGNVKSGLPGGHPRVILWQNNRTGGDHPVRVPCVTKLERQVV